MSKTHKQWMRECIEECKTCGNLNTASGAERLIEKFAEHMDESGSGLPEGGAPFQQLVTDADGVAKWEDRLAYTEHEPVEIVPEQTVTPVSFNGGAPSAVTQVIEQFEEGATYVVTFEGKQYECVCHGVRFPLSTTPVLGVGNGSLYAVADYVDEYSNGEPFCLRNISGDSGAIDTEVNGTFTVSAVRLEETVKTIDPKYLGVLITVKFTLDTNSGEITADKPFSEVYAAIKSGATAIAQMCIEIDGMYSAQALYLACASNVSDVDGLSMIAFTTTSGLKDNAEVMTLKFYSDESIVTTTHTLANYVE